MSHLTARQRLEQPFGLDVISFKPQVLSKDQTKGMAATYVDARAVAARLDDVFGFNWSASYRVIEAGDRLFVAECTLTVLVDGLTISRADVGESSNGDREASRHKSAFSDALKRAAVQFGVGRYLYDLPKLWAEYDATKKRWTDAGLQKLERDYQNAIRDLLPKPVGASQGQSATEPLMGEGARKELFQALTAAGLPYGTEVQKRKARGLVWFANYGTVDGLPNSMKALTAREADTALHLLRADTASLLIRFQQHIEALRGQAA